MKKKLLVCLFFGVAGLFILIESCHNIATEFSAGEVLYRAKCSSCHNIIKPRSFNEEKWRLHIDKYGEKMTEEEKQTVLKHLISSD